MIQRLHKIADCTNEVMEGIFASDEDARKVFRTAQVEEAFRVSLSIVRPRAVGMILQHVNAVYFYEEKGRKKLYVYVKDSTARAALVDDQWRIQREMERQGFLADDIKILPSKRTICERHPFQDVAMFSPAPSPERELTEQELREIHALAQEIDDPLVRDALERAYIANCKTTL